VAVYILDDAIGLGIVCGCFDVLGAKETAEFVKQVGTKL